MAVSLVLLLVRVCELRAASSGVRGVLETIEVFIVIWTRKVEIVFDFWISLMSLWYILAEIRCSLMLGRDTLRLPSISNIVRLEVKVS